MVRWLFEHLRDKLGDEVELLHDVHERVTLNQAINLCKALEPYRLFFLEDPLPPEDNDHFRLLRQQSSIPIAMGELFNTQQDRKSTRLNSSHANISYAVFCLKKKKTTTVNSTSRQTTRGSRQAAPTKKT